MTNDLGVASRKILQHSSNSTLNVLAFENILSYAPIRVRIESTGVNLALVAGTRIPN